MTKADSRVKQQAPPHQLGGLGSAVSSPSWVRGRAPTAQRFAALRMGSFVHYHAAIEG